MFSFCSLFPVGPPHVYVSSVSQCSGRPERKCAKYNLRTSEFKTAAVPCWSTDELVRNDSPSEGKDHSLITRGHRILKDFILFKTIDAKNQKHRYSKYVLNDIVHEKRAIHHNRSSQRYTVTVNRKLIFTVYLRDYE